MATNIVNIKRSKRLHTQLTCYIPPCFELRVSYEWRVMQWAL